MSVELRPPRMEDAEALVAMFKRFDRAYGSDSESLEELRVWFETPGFDMTLDARVALRNDAIVAYGDVGDAGRDGKFVYVDLRPDPESFDAAPAVFDFLEGRAAEFLSPEGVMKAWAPERAEELRGLIESRGFDFDRYSFRMGMALNAEPPEPKWPPGTSLLPFRRETDTEIVYEVHQEAFSEESDRVRDRFDEWQHWMQREPFDSELWFLAYAADELAGVSLCRG